MQVKKLEKYPSQAEIEQMANGQVVSILESTYLVVETGSGKILEKVEQLEG